MDEFWVTVVGQSWVTVVNQFWLTFVDQFGVMFLDQFWVTFVDQFWVTILSVILNFTWFSAVLGKVKKNKIVKDMIVRN